MDLLEQQANEIRLWRGAPIKVSINAAGNDLPGAPGLTASFGFQHLSRIDAFDADLLLRLDVLHTGKHFSTIENETSRNLVGDFIMTLLLDPGSFLVPHTIQYGEVEAITTLNGRIGLIDGDGKWDVYLWGRNLTDEREFASYSRQFFGGLYGTPITPRTYGIEASYHF